MLDPATARLCVWRLPLEAAFRLFSKLGSLGGSIRERFSRTGRTRPALARPAFSRWLLENDRLRERWPCQWLNVLYFPFSETSPTTEQMQDTGWPKPSVRSSRQHSAGELGQKGRIQGDIAEVRGNHDRNRETAVRRIAELGNQSEADREANAKRLREITAESDIAGTRKRAFNEAAAAIIRGVASLREHARKLEEIARDRLQQPRRETVQTTRDNNRGYSR